MIQCCSRDRNFWDRDRNLVKTSRPKPKLAKMGLDTRLETATKSRDSITVMTVSSLFQV